MRMPGLPQAVTTYPLPPHAPEAVAEAKAEFDSITERWALVKGELQDAKDTLAQAKQADLRELVDAATEGDDVADPHQRAREAEKAIADLTVRLHALDIAVDEAGNRLAQVIDEHKAEWLVAVQEGEREATARFNAAIAEAQEAVDALRPARGAHDWLHQFDAGRAQTGQNPPFPGGRLRVKSHTAALRGDFDPAFLLRVVAQLTEANAREVVHV